MEIQRTAVCGDGAGDCRGFVHDNFRNRLEGEVLDGRFLVISHLASGGMGDIYLGKHIALNRRVAIKVIKPVLGADYSYLARFLGEARAVSGIHHPNIVSVIDFGHPRDGLAFFVMELLEGEDLASRIYRQGVLSWAQTKRILLQILNGLMAAHRAGIVHCDMKPANCFLARVSGIEEQIWVKILDFGVAKYSNSRDSTSSAGEFVVGTAAYMAPEQARGELCDERTDIYSVGCIAFEMLTGRIPYSARSPADMLVQHITAAIPRVGQVGGESVNHAEIEQLLLRCMAKGSQDRFRNVQSLARAVLAIADESGGGDSGKLPDEYLTSDRWTDEFKSQEFHSDLSVVSSNDWLTTTIQPLLNFELQ